MDEHTCDLSVALLFGNPTGWDDDLRMWKHVTLRRAAEHGARLSNADDFHESHDYFEDEWYNYGAGIAESALFYGMVQVTVGMYKHFDFENDIEMRSSFETALEYLSGVPSGFCGVDVNDACATLRAVLDDLTAFHGWQIVLDGHRVTAYPIDYDYVEGLDH